MNQQHLSLCVWQLFNHCKYNITHFWLYLWRKLQWFQQIFCHKNQPECNYLTTVTNASLASLYEVLENCFNNIFICSVLPQYCRMPEMNNKWKKITYQVRTSIFPYSTVCNNSNCIQFFNRIELESYSTLQMEL